MTARYRYLNPIDALRTSRSVLQQTNSWKAWILIALAILWSWVLSLSPFAIGIYVAVEAHSFWPALWVPLVIYLIYGIYLAFWPILAFFNFIGVWYKEGFVPALLSTVLGIFLLFVIFGASEWLMFLAYRYAEKAAQFGEASSVATVTTTVDDAVPPDVSELGALVGSVKGNKYHYPWCEHAQGLTGKIWFSSSEEAHRQGYQPCKVCNPPSSRK